ncbi:DUF881 domain-containing protein [Phytohabitans suffuscus]|uniref:Membrane protein n=1 Tax=Phytohabitans suffuscus TaxID=624315 RepID=A0A6F8YZG5_9ACTN|nr:DUF881 domain-containing protein [Phytohabitans suffuscus]BCB91456.1 membrane protein [Phytohabitans suffuscus]
MTERPPTPDPRRDRSDDKSRVYAPDFLTELFRNPLDQGYADAARRKALGGEPRGWRATGVRLVSALTLVAVGFLLVVAYRQTMSDEPSRTQARAGLVDQIEQRQSTTDDLQRRADELRDEVTRQRDAVLDDRDAARLRDQEAAAGLARVRGDGVEVRLDDAPDAVDAVTGAGKPDLGRVLDRDLQEIANALWSAGAEAISINDQRLTATSTIRAAGSAILVDFRPVNRPYVVRAIGPGDMEDDFKDSDTARLFRALVEDEGMSFSVRGVDDLTLPAASDPQLRYATPSPTATPTPRTTEGGK